jgi:hypothetical protein
MKQKDQCDGPAESQGEHKLRLAGELLDDIELNRLPTENLLLKIARLARLVRDNDTRALGYITNCRDLSPTIPYQSNLWV